MKQNYLWKFIYFAGFWLLHCHFEWHLAIGMGLIIQIGDTNEMRKAPVDFPRCGSYLPKIYDGILRH